MPSEHKGGLCFDYWVANPWLNHTVKPSPAVPGCVPRRPHADQVPLSSADHVDHGDYLHEHYDDHTDVTETSLGRHNDDGEAGRPNPSDLNSDLPDPILNNIPSSSSRDSRRESPCEADSAPPGPTQERNTLYAGTPGDDRHDEKPTPIDSNHLDKLNGIGLGSISSLSSACQPGSRSTSGPAAGCAETSRYRPTRRSQAHRQRLMRRAC